VTLDSGFIAGTPVRTPEGPRPIEQLQVGDLVLTRLEAGRAAARRISRTAVHPDLEVLYVGYRVQGAAGASESLTVGFHHPFRVEPDGWTAAVRLQPQSGPTGHLVLSDGSDALLEGIAPIYATDRPGVVWVGFGGGRNNAGTLWNYLERRVVRQAVDYDWEAWDPGQRGRPQAADLFFRTTVYDIEVEDGHCYFVGPLGVCVADASPEGGNRRSHAAELVMARPDSPVDVDVDVDAAAGALQELAAQAGAGDLQAMHGYGLGLLRGAATAQQLRSGYEWLLQAADRGHVQAQYLVGAMSKDARKSARYLLLAASQGHPRAQFDIGLRYDEGRGVERDVAQAMRWYGKSLAQGTMAACYNLGKLWSFGGNGVTDADTPARWYQERAEEGDPVGQWVAGLCHQSGHAGAERDQDEAIRHFRLACAQTFGPAICSLAAVYEHGLGVAQDLAEALRLYYQAANLNVPEAMFRLGCMHRDGSGIPVDGAQALAWLKKATDSGWEPAREALKKLPEGDFRKARQLLEMAERAADGAGPPAKLLWEFGKRVDDPVDPGSLPLAFALYLHAAQQGHTEAQLEVASRYLRGTGVGEDSAAAAHWYQHASEQGSADAQAALAQLYETGNGVAADPGQARLLYERAAQQGHRDAQFRLGLRASRQPTLAELGIESAAQVKRPWWKLS
jgi:TPR repeat protein